MKCMCKRLGIALSRHLTFGGMNVMLEETINQTVVGLDVTDYGFTYKFPDMLKIDIRKEEETGEGGGKKEEKEEEKETQEISSKVMDTPVILSPKPQESDVSSLEESEVRDKVNTLDVVRFQQLLAESFSSVMNNEFLNTEGSIEEMNDADVDLTYSQTHLESFLTSRIYIYIIYRETQRKPQSTEFPIPPIHLHKITTGFPLLQDPPTSPPFPFNQKHWPRREQFCRPPNLISNPTKNNKRKDIQKRRKRRRPRTRRDNRSRQCRIIIFNHKEGNK